MKLLILTQKVDINDPVLGFFHRWIEEFAKHYEFVTVICLEKGKVDLPDNIKVLSLGKEENRSKAEYLSRFYRYIWNERNNYDAVFVHMNPEYVILAGVLWRWWGKKISLWYTHKKVNIRLRLANLLAHTVFSASKESFRLKSRKVRIMGHGIDTDFFKPDPSIVRGSHLLSVGRLDKAKRHDLAMRFAAQAGKKLRIAGEGLERASLEELAQELGADVIFLGGLTQAYLRDEYRKAASLIHTSETGSLDKVVLEALACGLPVRTNDPALKELESKGPEYVREHHSLGALISQLSIFLGSDA